MVRGVTIKVRGGMDMVTVVKVKGQQSMAKGQSLPGLALLMNVEGEYSVGWGLRSGSRVKDKGSRSEVNHHLASRC